MMMMMKEQDGVKEWVDNLIPHNPTLPLVVQSKHTFHHHFSLILSSPRERNVWGNGMKREENVFFIKLKATG